MNHRLSFVSLFACVGIVISKTNSPYSPTWESLDARPLPTWYDDAKIGIFIHWGLFSVPSFGSEWFWNYWSSGKSKPYVDFMNKNFKPNFTYAEFAPLFTAEFYDPDFWADLFQDSGAKYIVFTSKHHEGFTMWPSIYSWNWNAMDVGPKRDLLGDLAASIRNRTKLRFGIYHSLYEWYNPRYIQDKKSLFKINSFVDAKTKPELVELVYAYKPEVIWSDGDWEAPDTYWKSTEFLAWLYNDSPVRETVVVNDRWGSGIPCKHGGYYTCSDRFNPGVLQKHKWENCMTIDKSSWGYRRDAVLKDYMTIEDLIKTMIETISCGGNLLMNVGPTHDGRISPIFEERLRQIGRWLKVNGEAIYSSKPWLYQNDTIAKGVWYTSKPSDSRTTVYATVLQWPNNNVLDLGAPIATADTRVTIIGVQSPLQWKSLGAKGIQVVFPVLPYSLMPCEWAWVLKLEKLGNKSKQENNLN